MTSPLGVRKARTNVVDVLARLTASGQECLAKVVDLSLSGLRTSRPDDFGLSVAMPVAVELTVRDGRVLQLRAQVARMAEGEVAFRFEAVNDRLEGDLRTLIKRHADRLD